MSESELSHIEQLAPLNYPSKPVNYEFKGRIAPDFSTPVIPIPQPVRLDTLPDSNVSGKIPTINFAISRSTLARQPADNTLSRHSHERMGLRFKDSPRKTASNQQMIPKA